MGVAAAAVLAPTVFSPAVAATTGILSGTTTQGSDGSAASNVCAEVYQASSTYNPVGSSCSDSSGHYSVPNLAPGQYLVQFVDGDTVRHDIPQWYNQQPNASSGNFVVVQAATTTGNINAVMASGGWITGTVTKAGTGAPLSNVCVNVYDHNGQQAGGVASSGSFSNYVNFEACTDASGNYTTGGLAAGAYQVAFNTTAFASAYSSQWYNGQATESSANPVTVAVGAATSAIDASLRSTARTAISGTVTDGGGPVANVYVSVEDAGGYVASTNTASDGTYSVSVPAGSYQLEFLPQSSSSDQSQWYNNKPSLATANSVTVTSGTPVTGINATLSTGGSIAGTVLDGSGNGVPGMQVVACPTASGACGTAWTGTGGAYAIVGLTTASYLVTFSGSSYGFDPSTSSSVNTGAYLTQLYPNTIREGTAAGTPVSVVSGTTRSGVDDTAVLGSTFSGTVTDAVTGAPLANICVYPQSTSYTGYYGGQGICSDSAGTYTTSGVPTGSYQLDFTNTQGRYIQQWYDNQPDQTTANVLQTTQPTDQSGLNAAMQLGGNITGTVTDSAGGAPLVNVCVTLYPVGSPTSSGFTGGCTNSTGNYSSPAVPAGQYDVQFVDNSGVYGSQYFNGATSLATATHVTVTQGQTSSAVNASLTAQTVPGAPINVVATGADGAATVTFSAPTSDGGSPITGYTITPSPACPACTGLTSASASSTVNGLTNGTAYTFTVAATNTTGTGAPSAASNSVIPNPTSGPPTVPGAPTNVLASANVSTVALSFSAPTSDGGSPITGYTITPSPGCSSCHGLTPSGTSASVTGLTTGTTYTFTLSAANAIGTGATSVSSNAVTPTAQAVSPISGSTVSPTVPATVTNDGTTATASGGTGTVTVSLYPTNPAGTPPFSPTGAYLDVSKSAASTFTSVVIKDCNLKGGNSLEWWNPTGGPSSGGAWQGVIGDPADTSGLPGCLTETIDANSIPSITNLTGTIFGVATSTGPGPTSVTTSLAGGGMTGQAVSVSPGTPVTDHAALSGAAISTAKGSVTYDVYSDSACTIVVSSGDALPIVTPGTLPPSAPTMVLAAGRYYWKASYSGDINNAGSSSICGRTGELETVVPSHTKSPTTLVTALTGGKRTGAEVTVDEGSKVTDQAELGGANVAKAGGTVTYATYSKSTCSGPEVASSKVTVTAGAVPPSSAVTLTTPGRYFWQARYSGSADNGASISPCGSEVEEVTGPAPPHRSCTGTATAPGVLAGTYLGDTTITGYCVVNGGEAIVAGT